MIGAAAVTALRPRAVAEIRSAIPAESGAISLPGPLKVVDRWQQRHRSIGFLVATFRAYGAARGGDSVSLVAYRSFLSVFPLLIALTTLADRLLATRPDLRDRLLASTVSSVPLLGDQLRSRAVTGSLVTVVLGLSFAVWSGLSAVLTLQGALCDQWRVPPTERPSFVGKRLRAIAVLGTVLMALVGSTVAATLGLGRGWWGASAGLFGAIVVNATAVWAASRIMVPGPRHHLAGSLAAGVLLSALQLGGTALVSRSLVGASATYGTFATVIALTAWFSLNAQIVVLSTSINVVNQHQWFTVPLSGPTPWPDSA